MKNYSFDRGDTPNFHLAGVCQSNINKLTLE